MRASKSGRGKTVEKVILRDYKFDESPIQILILDERRHFLKQKALFLYNLIAL